MTSLKPIKRTKSRKGPTGKGILKIGEQNEYRIARLFVWMGYFVRRGKEIYTTGRLDQATDLDVLALKYRALFSKEVITIESKTGKQGPLDRVFWMSGLRKYVNADRALLYRSVRTKWNIKDFAKRAGVEIFDRNRLEALESRYVVEPNLWLGICDWDYLRTRAGSWNKALATHSKYKELYQTLVTEVRYDEPFALIAFWIHHLRGLVRDCDREKGAVKELVKFLITDAVGQLAVCFLRVAQLTADLTEKDRKGLVTKKLIFGEQEPHLVERVFDNAYRIAKAAIRNKLGGDVDIDRALFIVPEPDYVAEIVSLIEELVSDSEQSTDLPQIVDIIMSESFLKGNRGRRVLKEIFPNKGLGYRTTVAQGFLRRLRKLEAVPDVLDELFSAKNFGDDIDSGKSVSNQGLFDR